MNDLTNSKIAAALRRVRNEIVEEWAKFEDDGWQTYVGSKPGRDLYRTVLELGPKSPIDAVFEFLARKVIESYPDRLGCRDLIGPYDARVIVIDFNDAYATTHADVLRILCSPARL